MATLDYARKEAIVRRRGMGLYIVALNVAFILLGAAVIYFGELYSNTFAAIVLVPPLCVLHLFFDSFPTWAYLASREDRIGKRATGILVTLSILPLMLYLAAMMFAWIWPHGSII